MHLHRILFVILENLLKGNPFTLATFWATQLLLPMPWVTATSGNWLRVAAKPHCVACHQQTSFQKWKGLSKAASHLSGAGLTLEAASQGKKPHKTTCICCGEVTCTPVQRAKIHCQAGSCSVSRCCSLLSADTGVWRLFSCLLLTPCPKDKKTNSLLILRLMEVSELENYLLLNNSRETSHHKFSVATAQEVQTELCFLALGSFHTLYSDFIFGHNRLPGHPCRSASCSLFTMEDVWWNVCLHVHGCISHHCSLYSLLLSSYDL